MNADVGLIRCSLSLALGIVGAFFWLDAIGERLALIDPFQALVTHWAAAVDPILTRTLGWLPLFFATRWPPWANDYIGLAFVTYATVIILGMPLLLAKIMDAFSPRTETAPKTSLGEHVKMWTGLLLAAPLVLALMVLIWPMFMLFFPGTVKEALFGPRRPSTLNFACLTSPLWVLTAVLAMNALARFLHLS